MATGTSDVSRLLLLQTINELCDGDACPTFEPELLLEDIGSQQRKRAGLSVALKIRESEFPSAGIRIQNYVPDLVHHYTDSDFRSHFRMSRSSTEILMAKVAPYMTSRTVSLESKCLASFWTLANQESFRGIGDRFGLERGQMQRIFLSFCNSVQNIKRDYVIWPSTDKCKANAREFESRWGFPGVVGAIDGTDVCIKPPMMTRDSYINRKGVVSIKSKAVCDADMRFIDVCSGWAGSVHDARMYRNSPLCHLLNDTSTMSSSLHIRGDSAYPLQMNLMTPFRENGYLTEKQNRYNLVHSSARTVIVRAFALLKGKWRRLKYIDMDLFYQIPIVIMTACVLHNLLTDNEKCDDTEFQMELPNNTDCGTETFNFDQQSKAANAKGMYVANNL